MSGVQTLPASAARAAAIITSLQQCRATIEYLMATLMPQDLALPTICSGWSVRDQLGHIIAATEMLAESLEVAQKGQTEGVFQPQAMAAAMQKDGINRAALLPIKGLSQAYQKAADHLLSLLEDRSPTSWDDLVPHPYLGSCPAVQIAGMALVDWFIHPWDIQEALNLKPTPDAEQALLVTTGLIGLMPKRFDTRRARGWRGRFRYIVEQPHQPDQTRARLDLVLNNNVVTIERDVPDSVPADLTFKGQPGDLALGLLGRRGIQKLALPAPTNETWLPRWGSMWISL